MTIRDTTREVIRRVEGVTGRPVGLHTDENLKVLATVRIARSGSPGHFIVYNPAVKMAPDYVICWHCGFILRLFANPPEARFDFQPSDHATAVVRDAVQQHKGLPSNLPKEVRDGFVRQISDGALLQLRSYPVGFRVDEWLRSEYPDLIPLQREWALRQLQDNQNTLKADVRGLIPPLVYQPVLEMNAALAQFWATMLEDPKLTVPWQAAGALSRGKILLEALTSTPASPESDRQLVDAWGKELGLTGWYDWVPYSLD